MRCVSPYQELEYGFYELFECASELKLSVFDALPPKERGTVALNIEIQSDKQISMVISGATYAFRQQFAEANIPGGWANPQGATPAEKGPYPGI